MHTNPAIQKINYLSQNDLEISLLRLDLIHPIVSGNKWYKLRFYIQEALNQKAICIASFGGPYSNHLVALAYAAKQNNLQSTGYVRANQGEPITPTLQEARNYGMELIFLGRSQFQSKKEQLIFDKDLKKESKIYLVDEGGYGIMGARGAATIITDLEKQNYDYIIAAVGTGTMLAGIINACNSNQSIVGIPILKNEGTIGSEIKSLLLDPQKQFHLLHQFHQGGYAKTTPSQIAYMNFLWEAEKIPTDIVYTGKLLFAVDQLVKENYFKLASKILVIHSGGLQGNRSLAKDVLRFNNL